MAFLINSQSFKHRVGRKDRNCRSHSDWGKSGPSRSEWGAICPGAQRPGWNARITQRAAQDKTQRAGNRLRKRPSQTAINLGCDLPAAPMTGAARTKLREISKCHHQAPLRNCSFVIYYVPPGTYNSFCSAVLEGFQLGWPAGLHATSPCQWEIFP